MGAFEPCPSAKLLLTAIKAEDPVQHEKALLLVEAHQKFIVVLLNCKAGVDKTVASIRAQEALSWALRGIYDQLIKDKMEQRA